MESLYVASPAAVLEVQMKEVRKCVVCSKAFVATRENTICCSEPCKKKRRLQVAAQQRKIAAQKSERAKEKKEKKQRSITDIAVAARHAGMTYGQYVARMGL